MFPPNLAPRPLQTGQARNMVQKAPQISTGDQFQCHSVTCFCSTTKTKIRNPCISATHKIRYSYKARGPPASPFPGPGSSPRGRERGLPAIPDTFRIDKLLIFQTTNYPSATLTRLCLPPASSLFQGSKRIWGNPGGAGSKNKRPFKISTKNLAVHWRGRIQNSELPRNGFRIGLRG